MSCCALATLLWLWCDHLRNSQPGRRESPAKSILDNHWNVHTLKQKAASHYLTRSHSYKLPTWQVVKGLMLQSNCGTSWMDTWRLNVFPRNSIILGSSSSLPPLLHSLVATSWYQTVRVVLGERRVRELEKKRHFILLIEAVYEIRTQVQLILINNSPL